MNVITRTAATTLVAASLLFAGGAAAEEKFGVTVYPGAKLDRRTTDLLKQVANLDAGCYRTDASVADVVAFYKSQPGFQAVSETESAATLRKGVVDVAVQRPWLDMRTGALNKDTLISVVKRP